MPRRLSKPSYLLHKPSGRARVRIDGCDVYLDGKYGSQESRDHYDQVCQDWLLRQDLSRCRLTIDDLAVLYTQHADGYYLKNGQPTSEPNNIRIALRPLVKMYGATQAAEFGPLKLKAVRELMIEDGNVRTSINRMVGRIRRMFRWAASDELVPAEIYNRLRTVDGLRRGRSKAVESDPVKPVPEAFVNAIEPHVSRQVWAMVQLQVLTGARPGEILTMRGADLNMSGKVWEYIPESHKGEHHGRSRFIFLGPRSQLIVREFLKPDLTAYLFSPADARAELQVRRRAARKTPVQPSQRDRSKPNPAKRPGDRYTICSYRQAVANACKKADMVHMRLKRLRAFA